MNMNYQLPGTNYYGTWLSNYLIGGIYIYLTVICNGLYNNLTAPQTLIYYCFVYENENLMSSISQTFYWTPLLSNGDIEDIELFLGIPGTSCDLRSYFYIFKENSQTYNWIEIFNSSSTYSLLIHIAA